MNELIDKQLEKAGLEPLGVREAIIIETIVKHITKYIDSWNGK